MSEPITSSPAHDINGSWRQIFVWALISLCSGSLGFGTSQLLVVTKVNQSVSDISYLKESDVAIRTEIQSERTRTDARIFETVGLIKETIKLNTEIVQLVKVQNELLSRDKK